jgi:type IV pilus assembly protein PilY1
MTRTRFAVAAALLVAAGAAAAADQAACGLYPALAYPKGEDADFFTTQGGVPNIVFLLDNSGSINRMAPDGAVNTWGTQGSTYGCQSPWADALRYFSPCGLTPYEGTAFSGAVDYADAAKVCPYLDSGNKVQTGAPGFDPDYYCPGGGVACNGHENFFDKNNVFHDNDFSSNAWTKAGCDTVATSIEASSCKGFEEAGAHPAATTVAGYCNAWQPPSNKALTATELTNRRNSCNSCLSTKGYWFSGYYYKNTWSQNDPAVADANSSAMACGTTQDCVDHALGICVDRATLDTEYNGGNRAVGLCRFPHLYFSGNFLNFHPPKYVALRKVMKDVLMETARVRLGLVTFSGNTGGLLQKSLNPSCNLVYPPSPSNFDSNRSSILGLLRNVNFNNSTPLAEALLNVAEMYRTPTLPWFSNTYRKTAFENAAATGNQAAVCFNCQKSSVIVITDGLSNYDDTIPGTDFANTPMTLAVSKATGSYAGMAGYNIKGISATDCPLCNTLAEAAEIMPDGNPLADCGGLNPKKGACGPSGATDNYLPKVAWYLHHMDFRTDSESGADGGKMVNHQGLDVYTIGYGLGPNAEAILEHAAYRDPVSRDRDVGGGLFRSAKNVADLKQAILDIYQDVNTRSTSFGSASVATLQATASIGTLVPRFDPNKTAAWSGHLYNFRMFSEFSAGCKPTAVGQPFDPNDKDCDRACTSIFLQDADGSFLQENDDGQFVKNSPSNLPACGPSNLCASCASVGTTPATPVWEAGAKLAATKWANRRAYTVVDANLDGKLDAQDPPVLLRDDVATAKMLLPYVNAGGETCKTIAILLSTAGNAADATAINTELTITATHTKREYTTCVQTMIRYLLGADVFDQNANGDFRDDRPTKLGDMFHSSPIQVYPPFSKNSILGDRYPDQTLPTLWEGSGNPEAYEEYVATYRQRDRLILVGANDGFLHAFRAATFRPGDDPSTAFKVEQGWFDDTINGGDEEWAFMPPDLLPKLPLLLGNLHQFYADATPFVRDVWVDHNQNDRHEANEFHTVVIMGERRGGSHYFALDVTRATLASGANQDPGGKPTFLWVFPQPNTKESLAMGESFLEAFPLPPTIGPVRVDATTDYAYGATADSPTVKTSSGDTVAYHERWVTFLSGGFDLSFARGHGVYMVDAWSGTLVWDFAQPPADSLADPGDPRWELRFPVAATVGMVEVDTDPSLAGPLYHIFDTASFGDLGGQLWILRFFDPGKVGPSGRIENWVGARLFQGGRAGCATACLGQPFFSISSNIPNSTDGSYRVLIGSGDRFNLLDTKGGTCGPDNLRACLLQGCTVQVQGSTSLPTSAGTYSGSAPAISGANACFPMTTSLATAGGTCSDSAASSRVVVTACPNPDPTANDVDTTFSLGATCTPENDTFACTPAASNDEGVKLRLLNPIALGNRFYSIQAFNLTRRTIFNNLAEAKAYDAIRLTDASAGLVPIDGSATAPASLARVGLDDGWYRYFTHAANVVVNGTTYVRVAIDERVVGPPVTSGGRVFFNTIQPMAADEATSKSPCKPNRAQASFLYGASITTGAPGLTDATGAIIANIERLTPVPPQPPIRHVFVNNEGQSMVGLVSQPVGGPPTNLAVSGIEDATLDYGWVELDKQLHECRHLGIEASCASY